MSLRFQLADRDLIPCQLHALEGLDPFFDPSEQTIHDLWRVSRGGGTAQYIRFCSLLMYPLLCPLYPKMCALRRVQWRT